ncbi:hypothetical protein QTH97_02290 [Variovorax sp. J22R24]|uniref:hypothetical protein n=1 Tax=Variovorax gracilis TaxID=3053502 RepID=UPI002578992C|nr:hypothetical protein [Variovorax sp. J22R24]MDM0103746.1 hypothetical protein [Variovorax sp. J22R24]
MSDFRVIQEAPDPTPGAGVWDQAARDTMDPIPNTEHVVRARNFDRMLAAYDQIAANIEANLVELRRIDQTRFDMHFAHLAKANLPRSVPDPTLSPSFTTVEAAFLRAGNHPPVQRRASNVVGEPFHMTEEEFRQRKREEAEEFQRRTSPVSTARKPSLAKNAPQPWKEPYK